jgi:hypothetical protein
VTVEDVRNDPRVLPAFDGTTLCACGCGQVVPALSRFQLGNVITMEQEGLPPVRFLVNCVQGLHPMILSAYYAEIMHPIIAAAGSSGSLH